VKQTYQCIVVAVEKETEEDIISNPPADYVFEEGDYLIAIAPDRPRLL
jgi:K+/H+ antiporter YhaU regulatory subunit KhtT